MSDSYLFSVRRQGSSQRWANLFEGPKPALLHLLQVMGRTLPDNNFRVMYRIIERPSMSEINTSDAHMLLRWLTSEYHDDPTAFTAQLVREDGDRIVAIEEI